jgi:hypothetical protein
LKNDVNHFHQARILFFTVATKLKSISGTHY